MAKKSAGILLYRLRENKPEFFIVHPGGPLWVKKEEGAWSIPKGEFEEEDPLDAAIREFMEETGKELSGNFITLKPVIQSSGKLVHAFALEHDLDETTIHSNTFTMEWPPKSGRQKEFPEIDRGGWFDAETCKAKLNKAQRAFVDELLMKLSL